MKRLIAIALLLATGAAVYLVSRSPSVAPAPQTLSSQIPAAQPAPIPLAQKPKPVAQPSPGPVADSPTAVTDTRNADFRPTPPPPAKVDSLPADLADVSPETALENMRTVVRQYGSMFAGNPVGTNPEITLALQGENPKHINFLKADGNRVNSQGELVDVWGTPYFFHQISGTEMEIRSAGPDRVMYTGDDLVIK
jgi:hypothetical protein